MVVASQHATKPLLIRGHFLVQPFSQWPSAELIGGTALPPGV